MDFLFNIDVNLFLWIHKSLANPFFDAVMPVIREKETWYILYAVLLVWVGLAYKKATWKVLLAIALVILLSDQISGIALKEAIGRIRPCRLPSLADAIRPIVHCSGAHSFPSAHASNHFAVATFLALLKLPGYKWLNPLLFLWASVICFAQLYVGVHFPSDIIAGGLIGSMFAFLVYLFFKRSR